LRGASGLLNDGTPSLERNVASRIDIQIKVRIAVRRTGLPSVRSAQRHGFDVLQQGEAISYLFGELEAG
jgi:hypothetical protein